MHGGDTSGRLCSSKAAASHGIQSLLRNRYGCNKAFRQCIVSDSAFAVSRPSGKIRMAARVFPVGLECGPMQNQDANTRPMLPVLNCMFKPVGKINGIAKTEAITAAADFLI